MNHKNFAAYLLSTAMCFSAASAYGQQVTAGGGTQDATPADTGEIVVTALKQGTSAMKTPATVSILAPAELAQRNITTLNQLNALVPGLMMTNQTSGIPGVSFRGLGSNAVIISLEPSVGLYIDGVYQGHSRSYVSPTYDIDHVEFIKGTQSTLLGKNVSLGAVSVVNNRPDGRLGFRASLSHTEGVRGTKFEGSLNLPLTDALRVRVSGLASSNDGYIKNVFFHNTEARDEEYSGRVMVELAPHSGFNALLTYQHDKRRLEGQDLQPVSDPAGTIAAWARAYGSPYPAGRPDYSAGASQALLGSASATDPFDNQDTDRVNLVVKGSAGPVDLTFQAAHLSWRSPRATDADFTPALLYGTVDEERDRQSTLEFRASTEAISGLKLLAGVFYYKDYWRLSKQILGSPVNIVGYALKGSRISNTRMRTEAVSAYMSGTYAVTDQFQVDAGLRYTHERKTGDFVRNSTGTFANAAPTIPFTNFPSLVANPLDYNVGLRFQPNTQILTYVTYSKASKSGGYQELPTTIAGAPFLPETTKSVEAGIKARFDRGSASIAVFDTRIDDFQTSYTAIIGTPPVSQPLVGNSKVRTTGAEVALGFNPFTGLKLAAEVTYAHSRFTEAFSNIAKKGEVLTRAPKWTGKLTADYETAVSDYLTIFAGASMNFSSLTRFQFATAQPLAPIGDAYQIVNARLGLRSSDERWEVALTGNNLTDKRYVVFDTSIPGGNGAYLGKFSPPLVVGLQLTLKY